MKQKPFNSSLEEQLRRLRAEERKAEERRAADEEARVAAKPREAPQRSARGEAAGAPDEQDLWASAVSGVQRLDPGHGTVGPPPPASPQPFRDPDLDALEELRALVQGERPFDISDSDEFVEGCVAGLDPNVVRRLRRGEFAIQGHADLHGMTKEEAKVAVERFLRDSRNAGRRCVLLVHGRGLHSKDQVPVLKDALRTWLATARFGKHVLAFATARPQDGGAGAVYVLLRKLGR